MQERWCWLGGLLADWYAAWIARGGPLARLVDRGRRQALRLGAQLAGLVGLPFPWTEVGIWQADLAEVRVRLRQAGCPVCRALAEATARSFFWFLMEGYGEGAWIGRLIRAGGFCPRHMWQLADTGRAYRISYVVQYLSQDLRRRLGIFSAARRRGGLTAARERAALLDTRPCPMCVGLEADVCWQAERLVRCLRDPAIAALYQTSDGLCAPHFQLAAARAEGPTLRLLASAHLARLRAAERLLVADEDGPSGGLPIVQVMALLSGSPFQQQVEHPEGQWAALEAV